MNTFQIHSELIPHLQFFRENVFNLNLNKIKVIWEAVARHRAISRLVAVGASVHRDTVLHTQLSPTSASLVLFFVVIILLLLVKKLVQSYRRPVLSTLKLGLSWVKIALVLLWHSRQQETQFNHRFYHDNNNYFFVAFLGPCRWLSCGLFHHIDNSTVGTDNDSSVHDQDLSMGTVEKVDFVIRQLQVRSGDSILDLYGGWGYLLAGLMGRLDANISATVRVDSDIQEQTIVSWKNSYNYTYGKLPSVETVCGDWREIMTQQRSMTAHKYTHVLCLNYLTSAIGIKNFPLFLNSIKSVLQPNGIFAWEIMTVNSLMDVDTLKWFTFHDEQIMRGCDGMLVSIHFYVQELERDGFNVVGIQNWTQQFIQTIAEWKTHWRSNRHLVVDRYGEEKWQSMHRYFQWTSQLLQNGKLHYYFMIGSLKSK